MEIIGLIALVIAALYLVGRFRGDPDPATMSDDQLYSRLNSEHKWTSKYRMASLSQRTSNSLDRAYERRTAYISKLSAELDRRSKARSTVIRLANEALATGHKLSEIIATERVDRDTAASILEQRKDAEHSRLLRKKAEEEAKQKNYQKMVQYYLALGNPAEAAVEKAQKRLQQQQEVQDFKNTVAAAQSGNADAQFQLAKIYENEKKKEDDACHWYQKAASQGHLDAIKSLLKDKFSPRISGEDRNQYFQTLAKDGNHFRQTWLGEEYYNEERFEDAFYWLNMAAAWRGSSNDGSQMRAQCLLGCLYADGKGVAQDKQTAMDLFMKSAQQGDPQAQYRAGMLQSIDIQSVDFEQAYMWLTLALSPNLPYSRRPETPSWMVTFEEALAARKSLEAHLTPDQVERAKLKAKEWRKSAPEVISWKKVSGLFL